MIFRDTGMCCCVLTIKFLVKVSVENPLRILVGDWCALLAFLHNVKPEHTLNICPHSLFLSAANTRLRPEHPLQEYSVKNTAACHCCCFRLELLQMILYEVMDLKTEHKQVLAVIA